MTNTKKKVKNRVYILLVAVAIFVALSASVTYAVWSGYQTAGIGGTSLNVPNTTYKYLVAEVHSDTQKFGYVKYDDTSGKFIYAQDMQDRYKDGLQSADFAGLASLNLTAEIIGYTGYLGQLETLAIPSALNVAVGLSTKSVSVTSVAMQSPEEFPALKLITAVEIPASVTAIKNASFRFCPNLQTVTFVGAKPTIGAECFGECPKLVTAIR